MTRKIPSILSVSCDESLLRTRHWILEAAGFNVTSALGFAQATTQFQAGRFDLVILGHSMPRKDKEARRRVIRSYDRSRVLSLLRMGDSPLADVDYSIEASEGPEALVSAVRKVLDYENLSG